MGKKILVLAICIILTAKMIAGQYQKTENGIKTTFDNLNIELRFYSPSIIRVTKYPVGIADANVSLSVVKLPVKTNIEISDNNNEVILKSTAVTVTLNLQSGRVSYFDSAKNLLFTEKDYGVQFTPNMDGEKPSYITRQAFMLDKNEAIYGLGQQQNGKLIQRGERVVLRNENTKICIPYFLSLKGYGVFWDNYSTTTFTDNNQETSFESYGRHADYYFMYGKTAGGVVAQMRDLTGQSPMFPLWSYGYWQSRERYKTQYELLDVLKKYRSLKVPLDGIVQDWQYWGKDCLWNAMTFDKTTFPSPKLMIDSIHRLNAHIMIVAWPDFGPLTNQYKEFNQENMLIKFDTWPPKSGALNYNPYNPKARDIYWDYLKKGIFDLGNDSWWLDCSEPSHFNIKEADFDKQTSLGSYRSVVNAFPLMHTKGVYEHQRSVTSDKRVCILTRSAFAGQQRYQTIVWSGDVKSTWDVLQKQIPAALNFSLCGIPYWNADIGGFFADHFRKDGGANNSEFKELYVRWLQFATFTPMMRSHGTDIPREIFQFGKKGDWAYDAIEKYIRLRYRLLPYLYSTAWQVTSQSASILNALPLVFDDEKVRDMNDEFMFGTSILVAPVVNAMYTGKKDGKVYVDLSTVKSRNIYLPKGTDWYDFWTNRKYDGEQLISCETPIDLAPVYLKAGAILPLGPNVQYATEKKWDNLDVSIYTGANGEFTLYEDENDNYNYEKGIYSTITMTWNDSVRTLTIGERKGKFPGMIQNRSFNITLISDKAISHFKVINYSGKNLVVGF